jgi:hypothetical protein
LVIGGYAVGYHGYPRATGDLDIWISVHQKNAENLIRVLREFGFNFPDTKKDVFLQDNKVFRMGKPPIRIELLTAISGLNFPDCYPNCIETTLDGIPAKIINKHDLIQNKKASGRPKDLDDLLHID